VFGQTIPPAGRGPNSLDSADLILAAFIDNQTSKNSGPDVLLVIGEFALYTAALDR
jgi:hypothetical protein